jgi:hypothetical protein
VLNFFFFFFFFFFASPTFQGLIVADLGELLLTEKFLMQSSDVEREYNLFLFEKILLCCKDLGKPNKKVKAKKPTSADPAKEPPSAFSLKGYIYINSITGVEDISEDMNFGIKVYWKDMVDMVCFTLKCRNQEQVKLWKERLERQVEFDRMQKRKGSDAMGLVTPVMPMGPGSAGMYPPGGVPGYNGPPQQQQQQQQQMMRGYGGFDGPDDMSASFVDSGYAPSIASASTYSSRQTYEFPPPQSQVPGSVMGNVASMHASMGMGGGGPPPGYPGGAPAMGRSRSIPQNYYQSQQQQQQQQQQMQQQQQQPQQQRRSQLAMNRGYGSEMNGGPYPPGANMERRPSSTSPVPPNMSMGGASGGYQRTSSPAPPVPPMPNLAAMSLNSNNGPNAAPGSPMQSQSNRQSNPAPPPGMFRQPSRSGSQSSNIPNNGAAPNNPAGAYPTPPPTGYGNAVGRSGSGQAGITLPQPPPQRSFSMDPHNAPYALSGQHQHSTSTVLAAAAGNGVPVAGYSDDEVSDDDTDNMGSARPHSQHQHMHLQQQQQRGHMGNFQQHQRKPSGGGLEGSVGPSSAAASQVRRGGPPMMISTAQQQQQQQQQKTARSGSQDHGSSPTTPGNPFVQSSSSLPPWATPMGGSSTTSSNGVPQRPNSGHGYYPSSSNGSGAGGPPHAALPPVPAIPANYQQHNNQLNQFNPGSGPEKMFQRSPSVPGGDLSGGVNSNVMNHHRSPSAPDQMLMYHLQQQAAQGHAVGMPPQRMNSSASTASSTTGARVSAGLAYSMEFQQQQQQQQQQRERDQQQQSYLALQRTQSTNSQNVNQGGPSPAPPMGPPPGQALPAPPPIRRAPTAPLPSPPSSSSMDKSNYPLMPPSVSGGNPGGAAPPSMGSTPSFIKVRTHYGSDVFMIAIPTRGASYTELQSRVERKIRLCGAQSPTDLGRTIRMTYVDEETGGMVGVENDGDVVLAFEKAKNAKGGGERGVLNLYVQ